MKIAVLQRVCPPYRVSLFATLSQTLGQDFRLFIGDDVPNTKVRSARDLATVNVTRLATRFVSIGARQIPYHIGLVKELSTFAPDVIVCEGESHIFGYLQAMYYRTVRNRRAALLHWCFTTLPGAPNRRTDFLGYVKSFFRHFFDGFIAYSSFSRDCLLDLGIDKKRIFVATNVGAVTHFLNRSESLSETKQQIRERLGLPNAFTAIYAGTLDVNKRPELLLDLASTLNREEYSFVIAGDGPQFSYLKERVDKERLQNVKITGRVADKLPDYFRAADVLLVPGRGGIVMSEAMACGLPVVVHEADGTESDLVRSGQNGMRLSSGSVASFVEALENLKSDRRACAEMGSESVKMVKVQFSEAAMVGQIVAAAEYARQSRRDSQCPQTPAAE
jgi:glycosyltransferase involved in cell wall biosynthesis